MRRIFLSTLIVAVLFFVATYAGMAFLDMDHGMEMGATTCMTTDCSPMSAAGTHGMDCVDHCLGSIPTASLTVAASLVAASGLSMLTIFALATFALAGSAAPGPYRRHMDLRTFVLHQSLSTVVLRN